ncbi:MAG: hypothetical protein ACR2K9_03325 [Solirubrobacteraceae bacterium]
MIDSEELPSSAELDVTAPYGLGEAAESVPVGTAEPFDFDHHRQLAVDKYQTVRPRYIERHPWSTQVWFIPRQRPRLQRLRDAGVEGRAEVAAPPASEQAANSYT